MSISGKLVAGGIVASGAVLAAAGFADMAHGLVAAFNGVAQDPAALVAGTARKIEMGTLGAIYAGAASMVGMIWYDPGCTSYLGSSCKLTAKKAGAILALSLIGGATGGNALADHSFGMPHSIEARAVSAPQTFTPV